MLRKLHFNLWYLFKPPWETGISPPELISYIQDHPPGRALDLGCGTGTNVITLAKNGWEVFGVDFASRAIKIARKRAHRAGVQAKFIVDNVTSLSKIFGNFDLILDIGCYHSLPHELRINYIKNLNRLLAMQGTYMLYAFLNTNSGQGNSGIDEHEIQMISQRFTMINRKDGSERGIRPSTWITFSNKLDTKS